MKETYHYQSENLDIEFEINDWAERSMISLLTKSKETVVMTVVNLGQELPQSDFLPLTVDYEEKFYAAGKIFGSRFIRRESRPTITSILNARLIDRSLRPAFPSNFRYQIHIVNTVLSYNPESDPALLALLGSSFALEYLKIPWQGPIAGFKIESLNNSPVELFVSGTKNKVNMVEFEGKEIKEEEILSGIERAHQEIKKIINFIEESTKNKERKIALKEENYQKAEKILEEFLEKNKIDLKNLLFSQEEGDKNWTSIFSFLSQEDFREETPYILNSLNKKFKEIFQKTVLKEKKRPDGRKLDEIRPISIEIDILPRVHGSALFKRGLTHILSTVTLAGPGEELVLREIEYEGTKHFMHQYNFPPYSTGEIGSSKGPSRREIGHGELAEKALRNLIPSQEVFPYTIRVVSEVLSSNGSTSMGSVCASSLALMSAGVPLEKHVAGISIGMAYESDNNYELLTDIQGPEDFFGAMDFKVAGTKEGVTAIQLDVKIEGLSFEQIKNSLEKAKIARNEILNKMEEIIKEPRKSVSPLAPKVEVIKIDPLKIGLVIGTGGKTINEIIATTNTKIDIHPDGLIYISGENYENVEMAKNWIKIISDSLKVGEIVSGKVIKILPFGAILELVPQKTALLHISEIADKKIENIEDEVKIGEKLNVLVKQISEDGRIYVSLKDARKPR
jgi:polyribonucleotide nucleotidyltransferase